MSALERKGWSDEEIKEVVRAVYTEFDFKTIDEAKGIYNKSSY